MKIGGIVAFGAGAIIGGVVAYLYTKTQYEALINEEVESVKKAFSEAKDLMDKKIEEAEARADKDIAEAEETLEKIKDVSKEDHPSERLNNGSLSEYKQKIAYHKIGQPQEKEVVEAPSDIYEIEPEELVAGDNDRPLVSLTLYRDGYLCDEDDQPVDDPEELIGMGASEIDFKDLDAMYIRNDEKNCDYEILKSEDLWEES